MSQLPRELSKLNSTMAIYISILFFAALAVATPCSMGPPAQITTVGITSPSVTSTPVDLTIAVTNLYGSPLSLSFGVNSGFPTPLGGEPQPTVLPNSASTQYVYPTGWAGNIFVGRSLNINNSLIEGSYVDTVDIDVSYVDGFSVPITCSSGGEAVTGCNIDLFHQPGILCDDEVEGPVCLNSARNTPEGPPTCFFAGCAGAAYTFPNDNDANRDGLSTHVSCCVGTSCPAPLRQPGKGGNAGACSP